MLTTFSGTVGGQVRQVLLYIYFNFSTCFEQLRAHHQEILLYLCDTGIFHCVWVAVWSAAADQTATHTAVCTCWLHLEQLWVGRRRTRPNVTNDTVNVWRD